MRYLPTLTYHIPHPLCSKGGGDCNVISCRLVQDWALPPVPMQEQRLLPVQGLVLVLQLGLRPELPPGLRPELPPGLQPVRVLASAY
jgi:hypothetical protein